MDGHPATVFRAGAAFDEALALEPAQDGGEVGALQTSGGGDTAVQLAGLASLVTVLATNWPHLSLWAMAALLAVGAATLPRFTKAA